MVSPLTFLSETRDELQKVVWPSRTEVTRLTIIVIVVSVVVGVYIGGVDYLLTKLTELIIK